MKLLQINAEGRDDIEQLLVIVDDNYDQVGVLAEASDWLGADTVVSAEVRLVEPVPPAFRIGQFHVG